jgi:hypothetical protein
MTIGQQPRPSTSPCPLCLLAIITEPRRHIFEDFSTTSPPPPPAIILRRFNQVSCPKMARQCVEFIFIAVRRWRYYPTYHHGGFRRGSSDSAQTGETAGKRSHREVMNQTLGWSGLRRPPLAFCCVPPHIPLPYRSFARSLSCKRNFLYRSPADHQTQASATARLRFTSRSPSRLKFTRLSEPFPLPFLRA